MYRLLVLALLWKVIPFAGRSLRGSRSTILVLYLDSEAISNTSGINPC